MTRLALIGVGTMGRHFARHLVAAGHDLAVHDLAPTALDDAVAAGARRATDARDAAATANIVLLSLPSPAAVEETATTVAAVIDRGALLIDLSTSPPALARRLAATLGVATLDAPVSGGPVGAEAASLTIMCGGDGAAFASAEPVLAALGTHVVHVGGHGAGQAAKLCNNLLAGVHMAALCQAVAIARAEGIEPALLYDLVSHSTGDSRVLRNRFPAPGVDDRHPASHGYASLFSVTLMAKDLSLAAEVAAEHGLVEGPLATALERFRAAEAAGLGALDYSALTLLDEASGSDG